jgi:hypothetical protein
MMKNQLTIALIGLSLVALTALTNPTDTQAQGIEMAGKQSIMAEVVALDAATRAMSLRGPEGNVVTIKVPPTDPHFDQIEVGDKVKVDYQQSVALYIGKSGAKPKTTAESVTATSPRGTNPQAVIAEVVDVSAKVLAVDKANRTLTLELTDGRQVTTRVDESLPGFEAIKIGDLIHARITEAVALSLEKQ